MTRRACYVAGQMRGRADYHFPEFFAAEHALRQAGWVVFNPARMDVISDGWPSQEALDGTPPEHREDLRTDVNPLDSSRITPAKLRKYARRDCRVLLYFLEGENGDALVVLPGWEDSTGATAENGVARWVQLPRLTLEEATRELSTD